MYEVDFELNNQSFNVNLELEQSNINADLILNVTPDKTSQLINDAEFISASELIPIENDILDLQNDKVDKVTGKELSTNDFTNYYKNKIDNLSIVAATGNYNDLINTPTIPIVNNATLTIQKNGTNIDTFTANSNTDVIANIIVPTKTNELTNNSGFITSSDLLGYATETWVGNQGYITSSDLTGYLTTNDIVSSVDSTSTNSKAVGAKLFYDTCGDIETALQTIRGV